MAIACDHPGCENRCHQPMPLGWDVKWTDQKWYEHLCPEHSGVKMPNGTRPDGPITKNIRPPSPKAKAKPDPDDGQGDLF